MKIILLSGSAVPTFTVFRKDFISQLSKSGHIVYCLAPDFDARSREKIIQYGGVPINYFGDRTGINLLLNVWSFFDIFRKIAKLKADALLSTGVKCVVFGTIASFILRVKKRVIFVEGLGHTYTPTKSGYSIKQLILQILHTFMVLIAFPMATNILYLNSNDAADIAFGFVKKLKSNILFGPIGLDLKMYPYSNLNSMPPFRFLTISRILYEKGIVEFCEAAFRLRKIRPEVEVEFEILGSLDESHPSGIRESKFIELINKCDVTWRPFSDNVVPYIVSSHVFLLASYREGFPRSVQEAMAIGRPVIVSDVPGCRDCVVEGVNGFLVPKFDIERLVERMLFFIDHPDVLKAMGMASFSFANKKFNNVQINQRLEKILVS